MCRTLAIMSLLMLSGCTAFVVSGAAAGGSQYGKDERQPGVVASDSSITSEIKAKYVADAVVSAFNIRVRTYEGKVTLSGTVSHFVARDQAMDLAKSTSGVKTVTNQIVVED